MALDVLHERIRKVKNPLVVDFMVSRDQIPQQIIEESVDFTAAYERFCMELLTGLKDVAAGVRFPFSAFSALGEAGICSLKRLLADAKASGYYLILDAPEILSPQAAEWIADGFFGGEQYPCDALVISPYIGSDALKPFISYCQKGEKDLFVTVRSGNKSASELQELLTGTRHVYTATAEMVSRLGENILAKCGYSKVCAVASAGSGDALRILRMKHNRLFLLIDGLEYPSGNIKNCANGFDRFGHGAVLCAGASVTAAWKEAQEGDHVTNALAAAERIKKNISRYITIL